MLIKLFLEKHDRKLMKARDKAKYRHKGYRVNTVKTVMGEVTYKRSIYLETENGKTRYMFLLDEILNIATEGKISQNLAETALEVIVNSTSYRKAAENLNRTTNEVISHETLRNLTVSIGNKIEQKEKEEVKLMKRNQLVKGKKEIPVLFEETDGLWINLQGKELPKAPEGIEYRDMGTQESQIFSFLKVKFCSGRKSFSKYGANALAKVCVLIKEKEEIFAKLEKPIPIDRSVEEWIEEIENKIVKSKRKIGINNNFENLSECKTASLQGAPKFLKEIFKEISFLDMQCSF